ncbi:hypothetical protein GGTG_11829 [Gaeumannomyces tritici R3-111a-1]|uniref:Uncharacterized protein n=1 Tax=Gaeumannomyces tritici (strain R3-111a-1) TaxID=644352 RepID=J3PEA6_GAET3|nr:hypothetical protein GGTG_11829 [Gaeumannomyces tritici R3-111a-1]EJT70806.1 hypothetical protein GGTG_11829 [Gaeumannomyces tritici R3-111a-1]
MKSFSVILAAVAALTPAAMAADCYGGGRQGSDFRYTTAYKGVCNGGVNVRTKTDCEGNCCVWTTARFEGSSGRRDKCEEAFQNIMSQCVKRGRGGGEWKWNLDGLVQNYYLEGQWVCQ